MGKKSIPWWKKTVFYQIYMPSFCDGNQDGIGDFIGITGKLPYLKKLGVEGIWLTPFYPSPKVDNGYDISDYRAIDTDYGTMKDFDFFLQKAHNLGIHVIIDMVLNHTSTEHAWFKESKSSISNPKRNWYIWKKPSNSGISNNDISNTSCVLNNWISFFGETAWEFDESTGEYYYHSFAKEQADLNWANKEMKQAIFGVLQFWLDKGIDGFRLDVINNLTLCEELQDNPYDEKGEQIHQYDVNQEGIHGVIQELKQFIHQFKDKFLVGEISSDQLELIHSYVGSEELDTTFNFNLGSKSKFELQDFYQEICKMKIYDKTDYPTLFFGSHDMARYRSRFQFSEREVKLLATFMLCFRGIPFIYYGEEIGMKNRDYKDINSARDVQGVLAYEHALLEGKSIEEALLRLNEMGRDKSRNLMQWENKRYGAFSTKEPWLPPDEDYKNCNVALQMNQPDSIYSCYHALLKLRKEWSALQTGSLQGLSCEDGIVQFQREEDDNKILVLLNFSDKAKDLSYLKLDIELVLFTSIYGKESFSKLEGKEAMVVICRAR